MGIKDNSSHMRSLDGQVRRMKQELSQMEVSFFDVIKSQKYKDWVRDAEIPDGAFAELKGGKHFIKEGYPNPPERLLNEILFDYGLDITKPVKAFACKHSTFDGSIHIGVRYSGRMRTDPAWRLFLMDNLGVRV